MHLGNIPPTNRNFLKTPKVRGRATQDLHSLDSVAALYRPPKTSDKYHQQCPFDPFQALCFIPKHTYSCTNKPTGTLACSPTHSLNMAPKPKSPSSAHDTSTSPSYPMGPFSTGDSSYTNTVPEDLDETHHHSNPDEEHAARELPPNDAPPMYAPPQRHPYGSQQHLVQDAPAHPPPAYSKYTTAAQARWARSSRIAKMLCIGLLIAIVVIIVAVAAGVSLTKGDNNGPGPGNGIGNGNGNGPFNGDCNNNSDSGDTCTSDSSCSSGRCLIQGVCC